MRALMRNLGPDKFEHLIALNALYRPGPLGAGMHLEYADRKNGKSAVEYPHPDLEEVLGDSYGIMVFQEQVMQTAQLIAGFSMVDADALRKAMGKKIPSVMREQEERFVAGCVANGHPESLGKDLFGFIDPLHSSVGLSHREQPGGTHANLALQTPGCVHLLAELRVHPESLEYHGQVHAVAHFADQTFRRLAQQDGLFQPVPRLRIPALVHVEQRK